MYVLNETYIFYADVYFIQNLIIKTAVLYLAFYCNRLHFIISTIRGMRKLFLVAGIGTVVEIIGLLLSNSYSLFLLLIHILEIPLMIYAILGNKRQQLLRIMITGYFFVMIINGILEVLWNWFGEHGNYVFYLCVACGFTYAGTRIWKNYSSMEKGIFQVEIMYHEKSVFVQGLYDTGNQLKDPYTGKGVQICANDMAEKLGVDKNQMVYVPYTALGNEGGVIAVFYADGIRVYKDSGEVKLDKVPIGVTEEKLFNEKKYKMILNEEVF